MREVKIEVEVNRFIDADDLYHLDEFEAKEPRVQKNFRSSYLAIVDEYVTSKEMSRRFCKQNIDDEDLYYEISELKAGDILHFKNDRDISNNYCERVEGGAYVVSKSDSELTIIPFKSIFKAYKYQQKVKND